MQKVSDLLKDKREEKNLTLDEISGAIKIKREFLEAIEKGDFSKLPSESHAQGFVKNYAKYLGIPMNQALPLFRREYESKQSFHIIPEFRKTQHKFNRKVFLSAKAVFFIGATLIVGAYIFFQYSSLVFAPELEIIEPRDGQEMAGNVVEVRGKTDPYATVSIEGEETYVTLQGTFRKSVYTFSGENKIEIVAKNRFGKESRKEINIRVK